MTESSPLSFPIVDAHQHFWDPRVNYHPWLCDQPPIPPTTWPMPGRTK